MRHLLHFCLAAILVTATAYTPYERGQTGIGALGQAVRPQHSLAVSRDLRHLLGRWVHVEGVGRRYVNDVMAARWKGKVDLCVRDADAAREWGVRTVKIQVVK